MQTCVPGQIDGFVGALGCWGSTTQKLYSEKDFALVRHRRSGDEGEVLACFENSCGRNLAGRTLGYQQGVE